MDCVEVKALRTSLRPEMDDKTVQQQTVSDDGFYAHGTNVVAGDDFFVDELFDFSNEDVEQEFVAEEKEKEEDEEEEEEKDYVSVSSQEQAENDNSNTSTFCLQDDFGSVPGSGLSVPADDLADLEWLSHFVEDSFLEFSLPYPAGNPKLKTENQTENQYEPETEATSLKNPCFLTQFPAKARSKRSRTGGRVWSLGSPSFTETSSTSSSFSSSSSSSSNSCPLIFANPVQNLELFYFLGKPPIKKQKKKPVTETGSSQLQRRCSHCHVQKTPQWRAGPLGAKTLCNACGVRYKSGRLLPEYRPACSPTFSSDIHSNNHRKVLEMRLKKEVTVPESGFTPSPAVQSF